MRACNVDMDLLRQQLTNYVDNELSSLVIDDGRNRSRQRVSSVIQRAVIHVQSSGREE